MGKVKTLFSKLLFLSLFLAGCFGFGEYSLAAGDTLLLSEAAAGVASSSNEFVELYNFGESDINLKNDGIKLKVINSSGTATNKTISWVNEVIPAGGYFLFGAGTVGVPFDATYGGTLLTGTGGVVIMDKNDVVLDRLTWTGLETNSSMKRISGNVTPRENSAFVVTQSPDPQNSFYRKTHEEPDSGDEEGGDEDDGEGMCLANLEDVKLNEIFPYPETGKQEYVELKNFGESCADVTGWKIEDEGGHKYVFPSGTIIDSEGVLLIERDFYLNNTGDEKLSLFDQSGKEVDKVSYEKAVKNYSLSFDGGGWQWTSVLTPGLENEFDESEESDDESDGATATDGSEYAIRLNELLPRPKGGKKSDEYIEIYNDEDVSVRLDGWILKDASKTKFVFPKDSVINSKEYLVLSGDVYKFALNNTGLESVYLLDSNQNIVSTISYEKAKENVSYGFDGKSWRWSKFRTPGKENKFSSTPKIKIEKVTSGYAGIPVKFEASLKKDKSKKKSKDDQKFRWDFGDGKKSYLQHTSHTFTKTGTYRVQLSVDNGVETVTESFKIKIKKYPKLDVEITSILPNPTGKDTGKEWIEIKNNSSKKVNLKGWKIATGKKKLVNHAISDDISVAAGKSVRLTRENSSFSLNNKSAKIELRYPNGKTASKLSYKKDTIAEEETCRVAKGACVWALPEQEEELGKEDVDDKTSQDETDQSDANSEGKAEENKWEEGEGEGEADVKGAQTSIEENPSPVSLNEAVDASSTEKVSVVPEQQRSRMRIFMEKISGAVNRLLHKFL